MQINLKNLLIQMTSLIMSAFMQRLLHYNIKNNTHINVNPLKCIIFLRYIVVTLQPSIRLEEDFQTTSSSTSAYIVIIIIESWSSYARCVLGVGTLLKLSFPGSERMNHLPQGCVSCVYSCYILCNALLMVYGYMARTQGFFYY